MKIRINAFSGIKPRVSPTILRDIDAQVALNADLSRGDVRGFRKYLRIESLPEQGYKSLRQYEENGNTNWMVAETADLDMVKSPIADDDYERVYVTGYAEPRFFANNNVSAIFDPATDYYKLGIPAPAAGLTVESGGSINRYYVYTFLNSYGDEGPPSATAGGSTVGAAPVELSGIVPAALADVETNTSTQTRNITSIKVYRTAVTGAGTGTFLYTLTATWFDATVNYVVGDYVVYNGALYRCSTKHDAAAWNAGHFTAGDNVADADLGTNTITTTLYELPPSDLKGIVYHPAGFLAGFSGNTVYMTEIGKCHTWNNLEPFDDTIVGLGVFDESIVVVTTGYPYLLTGSAPAQMGRQKLALKYPGVSKRSIVSEADGVFYAAKAGLVRIDQTGISLATEEYFTSDDWSNYYPSLMHGAYYEGKYFGWYESGIYKGCIILDFINKNARVLDVYADASLVASDGYYYIIIDDETSTRSTKARYRWEGDPYNYLSYTWRSKKFMLSEYSTFTAARVFLDTTFYDDVLDLVEESGYIEGQNDDVYASSYATLCSTTDTFVGEAGDTLKLTLNGMVWDDITVGSCADMDDVVASLNEATGRTVAEEVDGYLVLTGPVGGRNIIIEDGSSTAQPVVADLFATLDDRYDRSRLIGGSINEDSFLAYSINACSLTQSIGLSISDAVTFRLYVDDVLRATKVVTDDKIFRIPGGYRGKKVEIQVEGYVPVRAVEVGTSASALINQ